MVGASLLRILEMTNRKLRSALLKKLGITPQGLSLRVKKTKGESGPMSTEEATYLIAHKEGLDLAKYLDTATVSNIRDILNPASTHGLEQQKASRVRSRARVDVIIGGTYRLKDPLLPRNVVTEAKEMASKVYPFMYVMENSVRNLILRVMENSKGAQWWDAYAPSKTQDKVRDRMDGEDKIPWHGKRNAHPIYYTDFKDLIGIITKNWGLFSDILPTKEWVRQRLEELSPSRNIIAHNNPLNKHDIARLKVYFQDWENVLRTKKDKIP